MFVSLTVSRGYLRQTDNFGNHALPFQTNGAIASTLRILKENEPFTFTILSPVDELRMTELYGYHFEEITLLRRLQHVGDAEQRPFDIFKNNPLDEWDPNIYIPTKYVYIYIEKIPINYSLSYEGSGQSISKEGADKPVPTGDGITCYQGEARWIVMSKMMEWLKALQKLYPESISTYYEDDTFVCYELVQGNIPYNLGIDYGYNNVQPKEEDEDMEE